MRNSYLLLMFLLLFYTLKAQDFSEQLDRYLHQSSRFGPFNGSLAVYHKGKILLNQGYGFKNVVSQTLNDSNTLYRIGSLTKPFTALAILQLAEAGKLSVTDPLSRFLPDFPNSEKITIENLLTHSSGVKEYLQVKEIRELPDDAAPVSLNSLIAAFKNETPVIKPGEKFSYSNSNYILLAAVIEKLSGMKYEHYIRKSIFEPLGMYHSGFDFKSLSCPDKSTGHLTIKKQQVVVDFDSTYAPGCGSMYTCTGDMIRFYEGLKSGKIISDSLLQSAFVARKDKYGYGWFCTRSHRQLCISHPGGVPGFVADFQFFPGEDLCIIQLTNCSQGYVTVENIASLFFRSIQK